MSSGGAAELCARAPGGAGAMVPLRATNSSRALVAASICGQCAVEAHLRDDALIEMPYLQNSQPMCWLTSKFRICGQSADGAYLRDDALIAAPYLQISQPMCWLTSKFRICGQCDDALIAVPYLQNSQPMCCWCVARCFCCAFAYLGGGGHSCCIDWGRFAR